MKTNSKIYELNAWRDNNITINCTQGEYSELTFTGSSLTDIKGKKINFQLYDGDGLIDLSDVDEVYYDAVNEQGEQSACDALVINKTTNTVILGLSKAMTSKSGKVKGEIRLVTSKVDGNNKITSTNTKFYGVNLKVYKSNDDGGLIGNPQFSELEKLITYIKIAGKITDEGIDFAKYLIDDSSEATNKTYSSSKIEELINVIEANITDIDELVNSKADKETVEKELAKKADTTDLDTKENISNKIDTIDFPSTTYYPSSKAVWDYVANELNTPKAEIESLKSNKLDKTDFNTYKTATDKAIADNTKSIKTNKTSVDNLSKDFNSYKTSNDNAVNNKVDTTDFNAYKTSTDKAIKDNADNINLLDTNKANLVQSKNLFDLKSYLDMLSNNQHPVVNGVLNNVDKSNNSFTFTTTGHDCYTDFWQGETPFKVPVEKNTTYTMSWDFSGSDGLTFVFFNGVSGSGNMVQTKNSNKKLTFTTKEDTTFVTVRFGITDGGISATIGNIQIELGEVATDYMPCRVATGVKELDNKVDKLQDFNNDKFNSVADKIIDNSIKNTTDKASNIVITGSSNYNVVSLLANNDNYNISLYGKNLQDFKNLIKGMHTNAYVAKDSLTVKDNTISYDMTEGNYCGIYFKYNEFIKDSLLIDKSCVISLTVTVDKSCTFRLLDENSNKFVSKALEPSTETQISLPIILNQSAKAITFYGANITETTHIKLSNIMIELGSVATEYEEYKDMQSVTQDTDLSTVHTYYPNTTVISDSDFQLTYIADTKNYIDNNLDTKENASNKIDTIDFPSTTYYPSSKAVWDYVANELNTPKAEIESLKSNKLDKTDFNTYKTATDKAIADNTKSIKANKTSVDNLSKDFNTYKTAIANLEAYIGITTDVAGLCVDYENKTFTRLAGAVGLSAGPDFDKWKMYGGRKRCNVADDGTILAYYGDANYKEDGSNGQVMVYQPKFYYLVVPLKLEKNTVSGIGNHLRKANYYVSATPKAGFKLHPTFYDANGNEVDYILYSAYEGSMYDVSEEAYVNDSVDTSVAYGVGDLLCSVAGKKPISGRLKGVGSKTQFETMANNIGSGWHLNTIKAESANQLLMIIELGRFNTQAAIGQGVVSCPNNGSYNCSSYTGSTASLGNATGMATETTYESAGTETVNTTNGKLSVTYRGVENPWGNIWKHTNGINLWGDGHMGGGQVFICDDFSFNESKHDGNYQSAGFTVSNGYGYVSAFGYGDEDYDWLFMPSETTGNSSLPVGDYTSVQPNLNGYRITRLGGSWNDSDSAGGFYWACYSTPGGRNYYTGGRLLYVPTATA